LSTKADDALFPNRVVIDTNVWISAVLSSKGATASVVLKAIKGTSHVFTRQTFSELESRIWKPKFDRYVSIETRQLFLHDVGSSANWVEIPAQLESETYSRDIDDDKFVHAAIASKSLWIITGDDDLLILGSVKGIRIVSAAQAIGDPDFLA
jgi:uncharacterized protein